MISHHFTKHHPPYHIPLQTCASLQNSPCCISSHPREPHNPDLMSIMTSTRHQTAPSRISHELTFLLIRPNSDRWTLPLPGPFAGDLIYRYQRKSCRTNLYDFGVDFGSYFQCNILPRWAPFLHARLFQLDSIAIGVANTRGADRSPGPSGAWAPELGEPSGCADTWHRREGVA